MLLDTDLTLTPEDLDFDELELDTTYADHILDTVALSFDDEEEDWDEDDFDDEDDDEYILDDEEDEDWDEEDDWDDEDEDDFLHS